MITELTLRNFRGFQNFSLSGCSSVNLFVGKNNAGKSSLLEALYLFACKMDIDVLQTIAMQRGEIVEDPRGRNSYTVDLSHFFNGHRITTSKAPALLNRTISYEMIIDEPESLKTDLGLSSFEDDVSSRQPLHALKVVESKNGEETNIQEAMIFDHGGISVVRRNSMYAAAMRRKYHFIAPDSLDNQTLARLWNSILVSNGEAAIVSALKILDAKVESIAFLSNEQYAGRFSFRPSAGFVVGIEGATRRVPLGSLGDGMKRLMAIAVALACAKDGALFIDEVDAGFHYSVMGDLWRLIIGMSQANNVQVFASTHSLDCIRGLSILHSGKIARPNDEFSLFSVDASAHEAVRYAADEIPLILRNEIEVRQ